MLVIVAHLCWALMARGSDTARHTKRAVREARSWGGPVALLLGAAAAFTLTSAWAVAAATSAESAAPHLRRAAWLGGELARALVLEPVA